jgi:hypothetical protein
LQFFDIDCFDSLNKVYQKQLNKRNKIEIMYIIKLSFLAFFREAKEEVIIKLIIKPI